MSGRVAGAGPEVVRVRVPAKDVTRFFPPGTGLRILSPQEFESRVEAAGREPAVGRATATPRLIRARHRARWDSGLLRGRSELVVGAGLAGPVEFPLEPWSPAVLVEAGTAPAVGARDSGAAVLRIAASPREQTLTVDWEQQPRPHSRGRGFSLGLPAVDTTILELELPRGWTASSQRGVRRGPIATQDPSWSLCEIDGEAGQFDVELRDATDRAPSETGGGAWMSTTTEVDLRRTADLTGSMINWTASGRLELDPRRAGTLEAELDPRLELIDVQGDAVQGYHTERSGDRTRVAVTVAEGVRSTTLRFLAHAAVPTEGTWPIPAIRPLDAIWTGGRTTVILDALHAVSEYRERAGRLVPAARGDAGTADRMTFEAVSPRSVADLVLVRPRADLACTVRGQLDISGAPARFDCRLDWSLHRGSVSQLEVDLSPAWLPDQVRIQGLDDPVAWHPSVLPSGVTRLRAMLPASVLAAGRCTLLIGATSNAPTSRGPLELPRVHPVGAAVVDEAWLAWGNDGATIHPVRARGLAWIDPAEVPGLVPLAPPPALRQALAWRWIADAADARIDRERIDQEPRVSIRARARVAPDGRGLSVDGTLLVGSGGAALDALPLWVDTPGDPLASWQFSGEDGGELRLRPLEAATRARLELPRDASARGLVLDLPPRGQRTVSFRASLPWSSPGLVPLLYVPRDSFQQGTLRLEVPAAMKSRVQAEGARRLNPSTNVPSNGAAVAERTDRPGEAGARDQVVHAFSYSETGARVQLIAEPMTPTPMPGVVRDALLTTSWDGRTRTINRLRLVVQPGQSEALSLELPNGTTLVRIQQDGADVTPIRSGYRVTIPAPAVGNGPRSIAIVVDYTMEAGRLGDGSILRPDRPRLDLPCLSFTWEVSTPPGWRVLDPGAGLLAGAPDDPAAWPGGPLGLGAPAWPLRIGGSGRDAADRLRQLDGRLGRPAPDELSFAEWFSRWDSGPWAVVIDRLALGAAGLGPRSSCFPGRLPADHRDSARALLQQHGLAVVPFSDALLVTMESELPRFEPRGPWLDAVGEALAWGSDRADRLQSVAHWRGEIAPRSSAAGEPSVVGNRPLRDRNTRWFSAPGWPGGDAFVRLADTRRNMLMGWIVAGLIGLAWLATSGRASGRRLLIPALVFAACLLVEPLLPSRYGALTAGAFAGSLAILVAELARRCRRPSVPTSPPVRTESSLIRGAGRAATGSATLLLLAVAIGSLRAAPAAADAPIIALFPYEGAYEPSRPPDRVILRLDDFRRMTRPADDGGIPPTTVVAVASAHRVSRKSGHEILVETEVELAARGPGPFRWRFPVSSSRDISARIGGQPAPIAVEPGGGMATVVLPRAGNYLLSLRRSSAARSEEAGTELLSLPINATPAARLILEPPADGAAQGVALTRGRIEPRPDGSLDGRLGPVDRIVVRWARTGRDVVARPAGTVEGLLLWDVHPAGDRVRARLTYHRPDEIATVRLSHERGLILRAIRATGPARVYCEDDRASSEWLVSFDPPLQGAATLTVDCWRTAPDVRVVADGPSGRPAPQARKLPRILPVAAERFSGLLGVRRPGDWTGRLGPPRDAEPTDDEAFVKAWGSLPDEPLTLCGTSRMGRDVDAELRTGPSPPRVLIRPAVQLRIESGRIVLVADADVEALDHPPIIEAELPEGMRVTQVVADGLIDWMVTADHRLRLIWQRRQSRPRGHVRVFGWIPVPRDPLEISTAPIPIRTPWVGWPGAEVSPGSLMVYSPTPAKITGDTGLSPVPLPAQAEPAVGPGSAPATAGGSVAAAGPRLSYVVSASAMLGELSWVSPSPRVSVSVESQLTIGPDVADWISAIRYDVVGGGLDRVDLKIPAPWAARARLSHAGADLRSPAQVIGPSAFWNISPQRPMWGPQRLVLHSALPLASLAEIAFPEVAPLGKQGAVDAYFRIMNATGRPLATADATGLKRPLPLFLAARFRDREFARDDGTPTGIYRMEETSWALRIPLSRNGSVARGLADEAARVALADVMVTVMPDRSVLGRALYEIVPESGRLLTVELPAGSTILWSSVEPNPAVPLRSGPSAWAFALTPAQPERVCLIWRAPATEPGPSGAGGWSLALPRAGPGPARTLVSVSTPPGVSIGGASPGLEPVAMARLDKARADWLGRLTRESLAHVDRSSGRDHERVVSLLIGHGLLLRAAERTASRAETASGGRAAEGDLLASIANARLGLDDAVRSTGLADDLASARNYLGLSDDTGNRPPAGIPEPIAPCRIRAVGRPTALIGTLKGLDDAPARPSLSVVGTAQAPSHQVGAERWAILAAALAVAAIVATSLGGRRAVVASAVSLLLTLAASAVAGGPALLAGAVGLAALARLRDRRSLAGPGS